MFSENRFTLRAEYVLRSSHECAAEMGHGYVGSEHILLGLLRESEGKAAKILTGAGVSPKEVRAKICENIGMGAAAKNTVQGLTPCARRIVKSAYTEAEKSGSGCIGTEHLLLGILHEEGSAAKKLLLLMNTDIQKIRRALLSSNSDSDADYRRGEVRQNREKGEMKLLKTFGRDMCALASEGKLDPVIGREAELDRTIQILARRTKNNPLLLGDPGVGKTAIVEGLASRIASGAVPKPIAGKRIYMLDISGVVAGTKYRGEFEERVKAILREVSRARDIILFIDEIHTIVGAGSAEGAIDAANILKPAMSRREIQVIGATTFDEYRKYIQRDSALDRRFQPIELCEPSAEQAFEILSGLRKKYEEHHKIGITDEAIRTAIDLSVRYINDRRLPDKAIDLIDEAASRARLYTSAPPPRMQELETEVVKAVEQKEICARAQNFEAAASFRDREIRLRGELAAVSAGWQKIIEGKAEVDSESIARVVSEQSGVPVSQITESESLRLLKLEQMLGERVVGQRNAIVAVSHAIRRGRTGLSDPKRPIGSFLFAGPTGVGKTELCRALAETVFGDEKKLIRIDMSEYMEKHELSKLIGSPPGYVGYDEGGTLTDKVRRAPYSVVLFDEIEKAHPDVTNLLLQILEDGILTDSHGKQTDFKNTIIVMTSNVGAVRMSAGVVGFSAGAGAEFKELQKSVMSDIRRSFRPELVNRIDEIIVFDKLSERDVSQICGIMLKKTSERAKKIGIQLEISDEARTLLVRQGYDDKYGARPLRRTIQNSIEDVLAEEYLKNEQRGGRYSFFADGDEIKTEYTELM